MHYIRNAYMVFWNRVISMAEFCLDCWNKIMGANDPPGKSIIFREPDFCEECGELKPVIIRIKLSKAKPCKTLFHFSLLRITFKNSECADE